MGPNAPHPTHTFSRVKHANSGHVYAVCGLTVYSSFKNKDRRHYLDNSSMDCYESVRGVFLCPKNVGTFESVGNSSVRVRGTLVLPSTN